MPRLSAHLGGPEIWIKRDDLLGLAGGGPVPAGLYLPEVLIDPAYFVARLREFGAEIRSTDAVEAA